jgi:hypothetical protein
VINYKTQLEELKKGCKREISQIRDEVYVQSDCGDFDNFYCDWCQVKISLLSQIIDDLKKEWQKWDKIMIKKSGKKNANKYGEFDRIMGKIDLISEITGMSSEELKEVLK